MVPAQLAAAGITTGAMGRCAQSAGPAAPMRGELIGPSGLDVRRNARRGLLHLVNRPGEGVAGRHDRAKVSASEGRPSTTHHWT